MDYFFILVILIADYNRILCLPLMAEMMGSEPGPEPPKTKGTKVPKRDLSLSLKPNLKPDIRTSSMGSGSNILLKPQKNSQKIDPTLSLLRSLDNPLLGSQLDALLGSEPLNLGSKSLNFGSKPFAFGTKPFNFGPKPNLISPFSPNQNPLLEAQLNKMFGFLPFGKISPMSFSNNPLSEKKSGGTQKSRSANAQTMNAPLLVAPSRAVPAQGGKTKLAQLPKVTKGLPSSKPKPLPPPPPKQIDPLKLDPRATHITHQKAVPGLKKDRAFHSQGDLSGNQKNKLITSKLDKPVEPLTLTAKPKARQVGAHSRLSGPITAPSSKMRPTSLLGSPLIVPGQVSSAQDPLSEMVSGTVMGADALKPQVPPNEIGAVLDQMVQMMNPQSPLDSAGMDLGRASLGMPWLTASVGATGNKKPVDMSWLATNEGPKSTDMSQLAPTGSITHSKKPSDMPWSASSEMTHEHKPFMEPTLLPNSEGIAQKKLTGPFVPRVKAEESMVQKKSPLIETPFSAKSENIIHKKSAGPLRPEGNISRKKPPVDTSLLKTDIGAAVRKIAPFYTKKKTKPKKTVCLLKDLFATCNMNGDPTKPKYQNVSGTLYLRQMIVKKRCEYDWLNIQVNISNVPMNDGTLFHGLHIHQYGEMTNGCEGMGPHYNPSDNPHGAPWQPKSLRHVGDLGNVRQRRRDGRIHTRIVDYVAQLHGPESIIGRGIGLKTGRDDLGQGAGDSKDTGNSGEMMACCVISRSHQHSDDIYTLY